MPMDETSFCDKAMDHASQEGWSLITSAIAGAGPQYRMGVINVPPRLMNISMALC